MSVKLNLDEQLVEDMIVILPENLFQGLHAEQKLARLSYERQLEDKSQVVVDTMKASSSRNVSHNGNKQKQEPSVNSASHSSQEEEYKTA